MLNIHLNGFELVCFMIIPCLKNFEKVSTEFLIENPSIVLNTYNKIRERQKIRMMIITVL